MTSSSLEQARASFHGEQLRVARELRSWTQGQLAAAAATFGRSKLTAAAVSQFELGAAVPATETLSALAQALRVDVSFLTAAASDAEGELPAFFRSLRSTPSRERKRARNMVQLVHRLAGVLDDEVGLPSLSLQRITADPFADQTERAAAAEAAAARVRRAWGLSSGPIDNVIKLVERHGIVCVRVPFGEARVDAFSVNFSDHPVIVTSTDKNKWDRSRFDIAHEVGHLVMHDEAAGVAEAERQAHEFAAAFLMPRGDIRTLLPPVADWPRLMALKSQWGVSIAALLMRARMLGVMSEAAYVNAAKVMSARGWRRHEPVDGPAEVPMLLRSALAKARKQGTSARAIRARALIPEDLFLEICDQLDGG